MTKRHWITVKECKELYNVRYNQLKKLVGHKVLTTKQANKIGSKGRPKILYNHKEVKNYGDMTRGERRSYMSKLNGTKLGRQKISKPKPKAKPKMINGKKPETPQEWREYGQELYGQVYDNWKKNGSQSVVDAKPEPKNEFITKEYRGKYIAGVNNPEHYNPGKIPVIDAIEDWNLDFSGGNVVKYVVRAGRKHKGNRQKDLQKALWYLIRMLKDE
jgi:hypothetical protein